MERNLNVFIVSDRVVSDRTDEKQGVYEAFTVARVRNPEVIKMVAQAAIDEADRDAHEAEESGDHTLSLLHHGECQRLRVVFPRLFPEWSAASLLDRTPALTM